MISSGLFVLPGIAFAKAGPAMILSYLFAGILIIPTMLAKAELATAMPRSGGTYFYVERSLGAAVGTFSGIANWFSMSLKSAFALVGIGAFAILILPDVSPLQIKMIAIAACLFFTFLNFISVKETGKLQVYLVLFLLVVLLIYIGRGFIATHPDRYIPFMPTGIGKMLSTAGLVFVSYVGLTKITSVAEEVKNPSRNIPLGMFLAVFVVTLMYILAIGITVGIVDGQELSGSLIPLSLGASKVMGRTGMIVLAFCAIIAFITTANAGILSASRTPMSMSRDRLLPSVFGRVNIKFQTPHYSIFITSAFMIASILFLEIEDLVKTASTLNIILFIMVNVALIIMRESKIQNYRPKFRAPLYPWAYIGTIIVYGFLLVEMGKIPLLITGAFIVLGWLIYFVYARVRVRRKSAVMHIVERVTAKELVSKTLEKELKEIVIERDQIIEDRFDRLIKECEILDLDKATPIHTLFRQISSVLSKKIHADEESLFRGFMEREKQSCTVIRPGLAIPHIIVPGEELFEVLLVRCKAGLHFSCAPHAVHTMFVLVGSMDERNYHLRALMAIAQIVQETDFEIKWMEARTIEELRDVILLSSRKRDQM